jgi:RimJ/RimL family protein N-acetyltransferase
MPDPMRFEVPERLHTQHLLLRPFELADAPALHQALLESLDDLREHLWFLPWVAEAQTLESATVRCRQARANFLLRSDLAYLAFDKTTSRLMASFGLHRTDWSVPKTEVGYWVRKSEMRKGYALEGVNALTDWALGTLKATRVALVTDELNTGSRAVAERAGFRLEGMHHNDIPAFTLGWRSLNRRLDDCVDTARQSSAGRSGRPCGGCHRHRSFGAGVC